MNTEVLEKILAYVDAHIREKICLSELAEMAGYSPFYFSKLFAEAMGMPVTGYIRVRKLQYALSALLEGQKVIDVAFLYAFDSHEGFTRSFTQLFGTPPGRVRKYLSSYQVPRYQVPDTVKRRKEMEEQKNMLESALFEKELSQSRLWENMHQLVFEVLRASLEEVTEGFCTEIQVVLMQDGRVQIADNGRGLPLNGDSKDNWNILDKVLAGRPITSLEYQAMGDFLQCGLQTVNSLCEQLQVKIYREGNCYVQDYIRGIAQHELVCSETGHASGMEILLKPDTRIFGNLTFSSDRISEWISENAAMEYVSLSLCKA